MDDKGCSKRFGFVTFSNKDNVADLIKSRAIKFKGKMINVGPAVKKNVRKFDLHKFYIKRFINESKEI